MNFANLVILDAAPQAEGLASLARLARYDPLAEPDDFWRAARSAAARLPFAIDDAVRSGAFLIQGLPTDQDLPPTPLDSRRPPGRRAFLSEFWLSAIGIRLGTPFACTDQQAGALHQNVAPVPHARFEESDVGAEASLSLHTENPFHVLPPTFVLLYCLRSDAGNRAGTMLARVAEVVGRLDGDVRARLRSPIFFERGSSRELARVPVLSGSALDPLARYDAAWIAADTEQGAAALQSMARELPPCTSETYLRPGDLLALDNRRWLHGRTQFEAAYDGRDRWLQRLYVSEELDRLAAIIDAGGAVRAP
jgi:L-asparagine oxygenase